jgi:hypothetical protein
MKAASDSYVRTLRFRTHRAWTIFGTLSLYKAKKQEGSNEGADLSVRSGGSHGMRS